MPATATIWHNPRCSKSRAALALLEEAGAAVTVVDYLRTPPSRATLAALYAKAGIAPREGLRMAEPGAKALAGAEDDAILDDGGEPDPDRTPAGGDAARRGARASAGAGARDPVSGVVPVGHGSGGHVMRGRSVPLP